MSAPLLSPIATCVIRPILPWRDFPLSCKVFTKQQIFSHFPSAVPSLRRCISCLYYFSSSLFLPVPPNSKSFPIFPLHLWEDASPISVYTSHLYCSSLCHPITNCLQHGLWTQHLIKPQTFTFKIICVSFFPLTPAICRYSSTLPRIQLPVSCGVQLRLHMNTLITWNWQIIFFPSPSCSVCFHIFLQPIVSIATLSKISVLAEDGLQSEVTISHSWGWWFCWKWET